MIILYIGGRNMQYLPMKQTPNTFT